MAFGFGFNKQKVLSAAEKFVQQGKLQNAIAEYEKIRSHDARDLTVANTIGDLYARLGDSVKAIECFKAVGDAYAAQGFTVKGIAMYKKITKLQPSIDGSLKLAELYTQQGLFNDARAQYLQVAEDFMKNGELEQAVRLFQKVLEMDPENVPMRVKLGEVYIRLGKKKEAWEVLSAAAESLRARGSLAVAEDILQRMLSLDPGNSYVLLLKGRAALEGDDPKKASEYLEKVADIDSHPEGLRDLLKAYLENGNLAKCAPLAEKLLTVHNDLEGLFLLGEGAVRLGHYDQALDLYTNHIDRLLAADSTKLLANLHAIIAHVRDDAAALEKLLELLKKSGESTHVNEVAELLAHASVKSGNLERARDLYQMLAASEPQNAVHTQNYQQVMERLEHGSAPAARQITAEEGTLIVEELEATAPVIDQSYPDPIAIAVRSAVTEADLYLSYNLPEKAIVPLLGVLPQAPRDVRLNQRLAALHTRFHRFTEAAVCCRTLESAYHDAGFPDEAVRYRELATRYEQSAGVEATIPLADAPTAGAGATAADAARPEAGADPEFAVSEMEVHAPEAAHDLSSEWEQALTLDEPATEDEAATVEQVSAGTTEDAASTSEIAETVEEARFYLEHFMTDQARVAFEKLQTLTQDAAILDPLRAAIEAGAQPSQEPEPEIAEINADDPETFAVELGALPEAEIATSPDLLFYDHGEKHDAVTLQPEQLQPAHDPVTHFGPPRGEVAPDEPTHAEPVPAEAAHREPSELTGLVAHLEASLGDSFPGVPPVEAQSPEPAATKPEETRPSASPPSTSALPGWPVAPLVQQMLAPVSPPEVEPQPVASAAAPADEATPAVTPTTGGAAAAAAPALSYGPAPVRPLGAGAQAMHPSESVDLSEMFSELKQELEEDAATGDEDPETHYNMGVAFREMGLLDEAIAELQRVCAAIDRGHPFVQTVQTYTWLAQCFRDKGVPEAAIPWYEKALSVPGLDNESRVAINYELGAACEMANDKPAALRHFTYVYGANIDYRDVAERIQTLKS